MDSFAHIHRCIDLREEDILGALESRESTRALLTRLSEVAAPGTGGAKLLLVCARMSTTACEWLDGDLRIEIVGDAEVCVVEILEDMGMGMRERVFPPFAFGIPIDELTRAVERVPRMIMPLSIQAKTDRRLVLGATAEIRRSSLPPPPVKISEESLFVPKAPQTMAAPVITIAEPPLPVVTAHRRAGAARGVTAGAPPAPRAPRTASEKPIAKSEPKIEAKRESTKPREADDDVDSGWDD